MSKPHSQQLNPGAPPFRWCRAQPTWSSLCLINSADGWKMGVESWNPGMSWRRTEPKTLTHCSVAVVDLGDYRVPDQSFQSHPLAREIGTATIWCHPAHTQQLTNSDLLLPVKHDKCSLKPSSSFKETTGGMTKKGPSARKIRKTIAPVLSCEGPPNVVSHLLQERLVFPAVAIACQNSNPAATFEGTPCCYY